MNEEENEVVDDLECGYGNCRQKAVGFCEECVVPVCKDHIVMGYCPDCWEDLGGR